MKHPNVLIAEDDDANRLLMQLTLDEINCRTVAAIDGEDALAKARAEAFDVILLDLRMPIMDGIEAAKRIREFDRDVPIIAVTAHAMPIVEAECRAAGMNAFLAKPFTCEQVFELVARYAKGSSRQQH